MGNAAAAAILSIQAGTAVVSADCLGAGGPDAGSYAFQVTGAEERSFDVHSLTCTIRQETGSDTVVVELVSADGSVAQVSTSGAGSTIRIGN